MLAPLVQAKALLPGTPPGGTRPRYFECDDGHSYLVKFAESNVVKLTVNEWVGWALASALALPVFPCAFVHIGQEMLDASEQLAARISLPGVHFGLRKASNYVLLRNLRVPHELVENAPDIGRSIAFDNWILNNDRGKADNIMLHRTGRGRTYRYMLVDHGQAFLGPSWNAETIHSRDALADPVAMDPWVADAVTSSAAFEPTLAQIREFPEETIAQVMAAIPAEWLHFDTEREALKYTVTGRRERVAAILEVARRKGLFPRWGVFQ